MMRGIKNSIAVKLYIAFGVVIVLMIVSVMAGIRFISSTEDRGIRLYDNYGVVQADAAMALSDFNEVKVNIRNILYLYENDTDRQAELVSQIAEWKTDIKDCLDRVEAVKLSNDCADYLMEARTNVENYISDVETTISYVEKKDMNTAREYFMQNGVASANIAKENLINMISALKKYALEEKEAMHTENLGSFFIMIAILVFASVFAFVIASIVIKSIRGPVRVLAEASKKVAEGDTDVHIEQTGTDEMGLMMNCVAEMVENIRKQEIVVDNIAAGDLRVEVFPRSEKDSMNLALKKMVADNNRVLKDIHQAVWQVSNGSVQLSTASQTLAQGATQQASAIEEISASIKDIAEKSRNNAEQTKEAEQLVEETKNSAVTGNTEMQEMVAAMQEINNSSENISRIIKVIDDIAFQTNILALNAAVEAQRAGTHGKGFAVVAEEVRNLAAKSAAASKETEELIEDSIKKVSQGSRLAVSTSVALKDIVDKVDRVVQLIGDIAKASNFQAAASDQIDQALAQVSTVVQTNSATSEECAASCEELSGQSEKLKVLLEHYKLKM